MRVNTNVNALNAQRNLWQTNKTVSDSMAKLSSGFRINRAADDAAGLAIANKLHANTRSLEQATRNGEQANSILQVMEGATSSVQKMLERMKELATQAASDNSDASARQQLSNEFSGLRAEITRTVETTKFQGKNVINGAFGNTVDTSTSSSGALHSNSVVHKVSLSGAVATDYTLGNATAGKLTLTDGTSTQTVTLSSSGSQSVNFGEFGISLELESGYDNTATNSVGTATNSTSGTIQVDTGANGGQFLVSSSGSYSSDDLISLSSVDLRTTSAALNIDGLDLTSASTAQTAMARIDTAIAWVGTALGNIGSSQNRIEYAISNAKTAIQNFSAAESVIRDLDMAEEMTKFSKAQILSQAGTAMLAQANQSSQGVLQLLRG